MEDDRKRGEAALCGPESVLEVRLAAIDSIWSFGKYSTAVVLSLRSATEPADNDNDLLTRR